MIHEELEAAPTARGGDATRAFAARHAGSPWGSLPESFLERAHQLLQETAPITASAAVMRTVGPTSRPTFLRLTAPPA